MYKLVQCVVALCVTLPAIGQTTIILPGPPQKYVIHDCMHQKNQADKDFCSKPANGPGPGGLPYGCDELPMGKGYRCLDPLPKEAKLTDGVEPKRYRRPVEQSVPFCGPGFKLMQFEPAWSNIVTTQIIFDGDGQPHPARWVDALPPDADVENPDYKCFPETDAEKAKDKSLFITMPETEGRGYEPSGPSVDGHWGDSWNSAPVKTPCDGRQFTDEGCTEINPPLVVQEVHKDCLCANASGYHPCACQALPDCDDLKVDEKDQACIMKAGEFKAAEQYIGSTVEMDINSRLALDKCRKELK